MKPHKYRSFHACRGGMLTDTTIKLYAYAMMDRLDGEIVPGQTREGTLTFTVKTSGVTFKVQILWDKGYDTQKQMTDGHDLMGSKGVTTLGKRRYNPQSCRPCTAVIPSISAGERMPSHGHKATNSEYSAHDCR